MSRLEQIPARWRTFLGEVDDAVTETVRLDCLGGFVVTLLYQFNRPTIDVDVLAVAPGRTRAAILQLAGKSSSLHRKHQVYIDFVGVAAVPEDYEDRLVEMFPGAFRYLRFLALDPYDLALSKLERNLEKDREDMLFLAQTVPFDLEILRQRYHSELRWQLGNPDREDRTLRLWIELIEEGRRANSSGS